MTNLDRAQRKMRRARTSEPISCRANRVSANQGAQARGGRSNPPGRRLGSATASGGNTVRAPRTNSGEVMPEAGSARLMQQAAQLVRFDVFE